MNHPTTNQPDSQPGDPAGSSGPASSGLVTYFQPFYNLRTEQLQGFEALVRRRTGDGRTEPAADLLATAEAAHQMNAVDLRILDDALAFKVRRRASHPGHRFIISVNMSWDLVNDSRCVSRIAETLVRHGIEGDRLLVDLSTDIFRRVRDSDDPLSPRLAELRQKEITFCLDGFTAADLELLPAAAAVPVDIIKLHPRLVASENRQELTDIATAVQEVGLPIVAAGVETREQLDLVCELGFEWAQGYLLGEPADADRADSCPVALPV